MQQNDEGSPFPSLQACIGLIVVGFILAAMVALSLRKLVPSLQLLVGEVIIVIPALIYLTRKQYDLALVFRLRGVAAPVLLLSIALAISAPVVMDELDRLVSIFIKLPEELENQLSEMLVADTLAEAVILLFSTVVLAGLLEEMLFRGLLLQSLERRLDLPYALFLSALVFGFFHPLHWLMQIMILGMLLGFLSWRTNSILPAIILHSMNNLYGYIQLNLSESALDWYEWNGHVYPPLLIAAGGIAFYSLRAFTRLTEPPHSAEEQPF